MIAKRIMALMADKNLSSKQFAEELSISPSIVTHLTSGRNNPSLDIVLRIKNRFPDISLDWLLFGTSDSPTYTSVNNALQTSPFNEETPIKTELKKEPISTIETKESVSEPVDLFSAVSPTPSVAIETKKHEENTPIKVILFYKNGKFEVFDQ